jgi:hypothetical protein
VVYDKKTAPEEEICRSGINFYEKQLAKIG